MVERYKITLEPLLLGKYKDVLEREKERGKERRERIDDDRLDR